jgi:hypothetical protein
MRIALIALCSAACNDKVDVPGPGPVPFAGTGAGTGTGIAGAPSFGTAGGNPTRNGGSAGSSGTGFSSGLAGQGSSNIRGGIAGTTASVPPQPPLPAP